MEIAGAENGESQNIRNALKHCASKKTTEAAVIFSLQDLTEAQIKRGFIRYNGLRGLRPDSLVLEKIQSSGRDKIKTGVERRGIDQAVLRLIFE